MLSLPPLSISLFPLHPTSLPACDVIDSALGIDVAATENRVTHEWPKNSDFSLTGVQAWSGLPARTLLTPYSELREMLFRLRLKSDSLLVDLGAAYGRLGFLIEAYFDPCRFIGYELVEARVAEGSAALVRAKAQHSQLLCQDLLAPGFELPSTADCFFIYDFGTREGIRQILDQIRGIARTRPLAVVGRGRATRDLIERETPWLSQIVSPEHCGNYSIYRSHEDAV
jgi:hypothetical protein